MKKSKILVSTALALCMGATAVTPAFAADNESFTFTKIGDYNAERCSKCIRHYCITVTAWRKWYNFGHCS